MNYEKLVKDNLGLARMMVRKYPLPSGYDYEDMYQEACITIFTAAKEFDASKGLKFSTIATTCIAECFYKILRKQNAKKRTGICISIYSQIPGVEHFELIDIIPNDLAEDPSLLMDDTQKLLKSLLKKERKIVNMRLKGMSQADIGKKIGRNQVYVSRKLRKLKALVS